MSLDPAGKGGKRWTNQRKAALNAFARGVAALPAACLLHGQRLLPMLPEVYAVPR